MWLVPAQTVIQVYAPFGKIGGPQTVGEYTDSAPWKPYTTKEDKVYQKEQVWDYVTAHNNRDDMPHWAYHNIVEHNKVVICLNGYYAMCDREQIKYLD